MDRNMKRNRGETACSLVLVLNLFELVSKLCHLSSWSYTQGLLDKQVHTSLGHL